MLSSESIDADNEYAVEQLLERAETARSSKEALAKEAFAKEALAKEAFDKEQLAKEMHAREVLDPEVLATEVFAIEVPGPETLAKDSHANREKWERLWPKMEEKNPSSDRIFLYVDQFWS